MILVDASVAVKWVVIEPGRDDALRLLESPDELAAPDLLLAEVANVLRTKSKLGEVTVPQSEQALRAIKIAVPRLVSSVELVDDALTLSQDLNHSVYDCLYLACAFPAGQLVTADEKFLAKCRERRFSSVVFGLRDVGAAEKAKGTLTKLDEHGIKTIERLSAKMEQTFEALSALAQGQVELGQFRFVPSEAYGLVFESPAYRRLESELEKLSDQDLGALVALGWLGRSYYHVPDWPSLCAHATGMVAEGRTAHRRYFIAQMPNVARGFAKLQTAERQRDDR